MPETVTSLYVFLFYFYFKSLKFYGSMPVCLRIRERHRLQRTAVLCVLGPMVLKRGGGRGREPKGETKTDGWVFVLTSIEAKPPPPTPGGLPPHLCLILNLLPASTRAPSCICPLAVSVILSPFLHLCSDPFHSWNQPYWMFQRERNAMPPN